MMKPRAIFLILAVSVFGAALLLAQHNPPGTNPFAADPTAVERGQQLYNGTCQACHGPGGQGDRGPALNPPNLSHGSTDAELFRNIRGGIAGTQMPPFSRLTDSQIWELVSYVHRSEEHTSALQSRVD